MDKTKINLFVSIGEKVFKVLFLIYTILTFNSLTVGNSIISVFMWISYLLGAVLLINRLINWKQYIKFPGVSCLVLMCCICLVSIGVNYQYNLKRNIIYLIFWIFYFFMYYTNSYQSSGVKIKREINLCAYIIVISGLVLTFISLCMMLTNYTEIKLVNGEEVLCGFIDGRLYGTYLSPNGGALFASIVILLSIYCFRKHKNIVYRCACIINCILQFFYIVFSDSRSGMLSLAFGCTIYMFFALFYSEKIIKKRRIAVCLSVASVTLIVALFSPKIVQNCYNEMLMFYMTSERAITNQNKDDKMLLAENITIMDDEENSAVKYKIDRGYSLEEDISNRRFDVWRSGFEIFKKCPWIGTTYSGFLPFAIQNLPETYIVTNNYMQMTTLDNDFLNLLVSNGIFCFTIYIIFVVLVIWHILYKIFKEKKGNQEISILLAICMSVATYSMFGAGILYMHTPYCVIFWLALGEILLILNENKENSNE